MNGFSKQTAASLAQFIDYAYEIASTPVGTKPPTPPGFPSDYTIVAYAQAQDDFWCIHDPEYYGFVAQSTAENQIVVAIRGTDSILEWLIDFEVDMTPFAIIPGAGSVEVGFYSVFSTMSFVDANLNPFDLANFLANAMKTSPQIIIEGHSLAGPIASMLALQYIPPKSALAKATTVYTFAAPVPGDQTFADYYNANAPLTYRVWNILDPVPTALLLIDGYRQIAGEGVLIIPTMEQLEGYDFLLIICNHSLMTYQWLLDGTYPLATECQPWFADAAKYEQLRQQSLAAIRKRKAMKAAG